jgi:pimeloyl-ACP methyl ester carboxylesterase
MTAAFTPEGFEHRTITANGVRFHVVVGGLGPLVLMLHGWPECWAAWRHLMKPFADAGFTVAAPDLRGFGDSDKPQRPRDYAMPVLVDDVVGLVRALGFEKAHVLGHDWGGIIAWALASSRPEIVDKLVIMNAPHPVIIQKRLVSSLEQLKASYYAFFFQVPVLAEKKLAQDDFRVIDNIFKHQPRKRGSVTFDDVEAFKKGLRERGGVTASLNYYRAAARYGLGGERGGLIAAPTLVLWGLDDVALPPGNLDGLVRFVASLRVVRVPNCSHWIQHDGDDVILRDALPFVRG